MKNLSSEELRETIRAITDKTNDRFQISQRELSRMVEFSATALNQWLNRKYPHDPAHLESALRAWLNALELTPRDARRSLYIQALLDSADNKTALQNALAKNRTS